MEFEQSSHLTVTGLATRFGSALVMSNLPEKIFWRANSTLVRYNFGLIDNLIDFYCRGCPLKLNCQGPVNCQIDSQIPVNIREGEKSLADIYPEIDRERILRLATEFDRRVSLAEMRAIQNPPQNESEVRNYRERVLWLWAIMVAGLKEGSKISVFSETLSILPEIDQSDSKNIFRLFYAGAYFQVISDYCKYTFHNDMGIPGFGSTILQDEERLRYCQSVAKQYADKAIQAGVNPIILELFNYGFLTIHKIRLLLPSKIRDIPFFTT